MKFRGYFMIPFFPESLGFNKDGGTFWIGWMNDEDISQGMIKIDLTVWSDHSPSKSTFASLHVHHDGIKVLRRLEEIGFLQMFEEIKASNFYDVAQCCARCDIPIIYHGGEYTKEMTPRKIYDILYTDNQEPIT